MEKNMETTMVYWGYILGKWKRKWKLPLGFRVRGSGVRRLSSRFRVELGFRGCGRVVRNCFFVSRILLLLVV